MLVIISTHNRPGLTALCLHNAAKYSQGAEVLVLDDHSTSISPVWIRKFGLHAETIPAGEYYARHRLTRFLASNHEQVVTLDSDMLVAEDYLGQIERAWMRADRPDLPGTGYKSRLHRPETIFRYNDFLILPSMSGACQFLTRIHASRILDHFDRRKYWNSTWDLHLPQLFLQVVCTPRSVVQHLGIAEGINADQNNISTDWADDFAGTISVGLEK